MRRSAQPAGKQANLGNEAHKGSNASKGRLKDKTSKIATMDNGTMVEAFKYLNYYQLAMNSLVSNRFRNLIQTHRHSLALLYVDIFMNSSTAEPAAIQVFGKELTSEAYNEWVILNSYSKLVQLEDDQAANAQSIPSDYRLAAYANCKGKVFLYRGIPTYSPNPLTARAHLQPPPCKAAYLSHYSEHFKTMFHSEFIEGSQQEIVLEDVGIPHVRTPSVTETDTDVLTINFSKFCVVNYSF
ncbi:hypothetical protein DdX_20800 [Ditylenchus destructor]|uniref:Uncharacterized protein n=1 Tax=Ditylenchus destructor TaxID=166010 RepID=A0AAD4MKP7_9BILA|nr:hypothetical protein DdX_20800 [Ditylenchus destructor]